MISRSALLSRRSFFAPHSTRQFTSSLSSVPPHSSARPRWSRFRAPMIFAVGVAFGGSISGAFEDTDFMSWISRANTKERRGMLSLSSPRALWWSFAPMPVAHCLEEELKIKEETPQDTLVSETPQNRQKGERLEERGEEHSVQEESKGYAVIHRRTTEAVCGAILDKKSHHRLSDSKSGDGTCRVVGRHYIRLISPAARRHIIRVYRLALGGIALVTTGFTCGLACFTIGAGRAINAGHDNACATLVLSGVFVVPVKLMTVALAAIIETFGRGINALTGGAEKGAALVAAASSLSAVTTISLPIWAPFAAVFLAMAALALSSWWSTGSETLTKPTTSNHHATVNDTHAIGKHPSHQKRRRRVVAIRRFIFYTLSFAEGALVVPIAKALLLTNFVFLGLAATFAVVLGFTAVAMCRGTLASPLPYDASDYHRHHDIGVGEHTSCELTFPFQPEEDGRDTHLSNCHPDIIRNDIDPSTNTMRRVRVFENVPLMKLDAFIVESLVCSGALVWGALRAITSYASTSSSLYFNYCASHCSLGAAEAQTSLLPSSSNVSTTPSSWLFSGDAKGGSVGGDEGRGKIGGAAGIVGSLLLGLGGFSPIVVGVVAGAAALFVASDTAALLDNFNTVTSDGVQQPLHVSSFFILADDVEGDADAEREDLLTEVVDAGVGLALALTSVAVRLVDAVAEVSWGNDYSSSFVAGCRAFGDRCFL